MGKKTMIQATLAAYPLQQAGYDAVHRAIDALRLSGVSVETQRMYTMIAGDQQAVFQALQAAFDAAASLGLTVMTVTISNACPVA